MTYGYAQSTIILEIFQYLNLLGLFQGFFQYPCESKPFSILVACNVIVLVKKAPFARMPNGLDCKDVTWQKLHVDQKDKSWHKGKIADAADIKYFSFTVLQKKFLEIHGKTSKYLFLHGCLLPATRRNKWVFFLTCPEESKLKKLVKTRSIVCMSALLVMTS